jgi:hypothetical protein
VEDDGHRATRREAVQLQQRAAEIRYAQRELRDIVSTQIALAFEAIERATAVLRATRITRPSSPGRKRAADVSDGDAKPLDGTSAK